MWLFSTSSVKVWFPNSLSFTVEHKRQLTNAVFFWQRLMYELHPFIKEEHKEHTQLTFPLSYTVHMKSPASFLFVPNCLGCYYIPFFFSLGFFRPVKIVPTHVSVGPHIISHSSYLLYLLQVLLIRDELSSGRPFPTKPLRESERKAL